MSGRICVVHCPNWPLVASCLDEDTPEAVWGLPMIVVHAGRVASVSDEAAAEGVFVGQKLRDAHSACPDLLRIPWSVERDQRMFDRFLNTLSDVVPLVNVIDPGTVSVGAEGMARYYGSEKASARALNDAISPLGVPVRLAMGFGDTLFSAEVASRCAVHAAHRLVIVPPGGDREFLSPLPTAFLGDDDLVALCAQLGIHTLGDFAALDIDQVAQRFGDWGEFLHRLASGYDSRHHLPTDIPPLSDVVWRSEDPCESGEQLAFAVMPQARQFISQLRDRRLVANSVDITLVDDRGVEHRTLWSHPRYFTEHDLCHRVRWQGQSLAKHSGEDEYQRGIVEVRFVAKTPQSATGYEDSLWGNAHRDTALHHTVSALQGKLGHQALTRAILRPGHHPQDQQEYIPWGDHRPGEKDSQPAWVGQIPSPHPATVFASPLPVSVIDCDGHPVMTTPVGAALSAPPHWLVSGQAKRQVMAWAGPWPVMDRWWETRTTRCSHRVQLLDDAGIGWLVKTVDGESEWVVEARYD